VRGADEPKYGDEEKESKWKESIEMWLQARDGQWEEVRDEEKELGDEKERQ
jgi:hypothetical protein